MADMKASETRERAMAAVQETIDIYNLLKTEKNFIGYDEELMRDIKLTDADPSGEAEWELNVRMFYCNLSDTMHGAAAGVIFDMTTSLVLSTISKPGYWSFMGGVSRTLNLSFLRAVPINTTVRIRTKVVQHGRTMALIHGSMESLDGKHVYVTAEHHKVQTQGYDELIKSAKAKLAENAKQKESKL